MAPLPYTDAVAGIVFVVLGAGFVGPELLTWFRTRGNQPGTAPERLSFFVLGGATVGALAAAFVVASSFQSLAIEVARTPLFVVGAMLATAGIVVRLWAVAVLGGSFTVEVRVSPGQPVVESGPYRWVSHPSYTGVVLVFAGVGLMLGNWLSLLLITSIPVAALLVRIRIEERILREGIGEPYSRFLAGRAKLLPGIW